MKNLYRFPSPLTRNSIPSYPDKLIAELKLRVRTEAKPPEFAVDTLPKNTAASLANRIELSLTPPITTSSKAPQVSFKSVEGLVKSNTSFSALRFRLAAAAWTKFLIPRYSTFSGVSPTISGW